jgi:hypothetical protein
VVESDAEDGRLSSAQVSELAGLSTQQIDRLVRLGVFPTTQRFPVSGKGQHGYRLAVADVERFLGEYYGPVLLTRTQVARTLGVSPARVGQLVARGDLRPVRRPYGWRYEPADVQALLSARERAKTN